MRIFICLIAMVSASSALAKDSLESVMARMKPPEAVSMRYQEVRHLGMLSDVWKGSGTFYAVLPNVMLKEQLTPEKELMGIKDAHLYYYNSGNNQKHQGELDEEDAMGFQVSAFKGLMNGDLDYLKSRYQLEFKIASNGWQLVLTPRAKDEDAADVKIIMRGLPEQVANKLELQLADGDRTEYILTPAAQGASVKAKVQQLLTTLETP